MWPFQHVFFWISYVCSIHMVRWFHMIGPIGWIWLFWLMKKKHVFRSLNRRNTSDGRSWTSYRWKVGWADDGRYPFAKSPKEKAHSPCKTSYFSDHQTCICFIIIIRRLSFAVFFQLSDSFPHIYNHPQVDRMWNFQTYSVLVRIVRKFHILSTPGWLYIYPLVI